MKFALAGNPNCGKTTLFNSLTGSTAHVGNWPGVTVDKREGVYKKLGEPIDIVDLPGIYSLSPYTPEEVISRNYIVDEKPDLVINIVDVTNLERNLYLTTQILEIDVPVVVALNMTDVLDKRGDVIDSKALEETLGVKVVEISALKKKGIDDLMEICFNEAKKKRVGTSVLSESDLKNLVNDAYDLFNQASIESPLFHAIKLIEGDEIEVANHVKENESLSMFKERYVNDSFEGDFEGRIADIRYKYITKHFSKVVKKNKHEAVTKTDKVDRVLTHRIFAIPIFLVIMFVVFHLTFSEDLFGLNKIFGVSIANEGWINFFTGMGYDGMVEEGSLLLEGIPSPGVFLQSWMGYVTGAIIDLFRGFMPEGTWYTGLVCDGLLTGLDSIFSFLPQILLLFLFISILEDSGYMARVAFIMDRAFRKFGLSGKSFIPLLMGFGCSVPAMMGAKTLEDEKERDMTIRLTPFFSCGAKAPIWAMLALCVAGSFLGDVFVFSIYLLGIVVAILSALLIKAFSKNKEVSPFIMELPQYHLPQFKSLCIHLWEKLKHFVIKASTIITASIILIWFLSSFGWQFWNGLVADIEDSILASIGHALKYIFYPCGWAIGDDGWKYTVATITGLIAKEDVVATMANLGLEPGSLTLNNAQIYAFAAYNLITFPCFAAIGTAKGESSKKGFWMTILWWVGASYVVSVVVYLIGLLFGVNALLGVLSIIVVIALVFGIWFIGQKMTSKEAK